MLQPPSVKSIESNLEVCEISNTAQLTKQIKTYVNDKFTGQLSVQSQSTLNQQWSLFFQSGSLIGCSSSIHPMRRWCRQQSTHCPQLDLYTSSTSNDQVVKNGLEFAAQKLKLHHNLLSYESLLGLVEQEKIRKDQIEAFFEGHFQEILFDIIQKLEQGDNNLGLRLICKPISQYNINSTVIEVQIERVLQETMKSWTAWQQAGLADISPNFAPKIHQAKELQRQTSHTVYHNLTALADGNQTLRDLSVKLGRNLLLMTKPILPYIRAGLIKLIEVEDLFYSLKKTTTTAPQSSTSSPIQPHSLARNQDKGTGVSRGNQYQKPRGSNQNATPLVAYIEDSRICIQRMEQILTSNGYRCLNIEDPLQALPMLLEHKPDLIFLDLVMPIANGYEICAQIRRVSAFQEIPVIIITSSDGIVDRVRAKVVGSSGFLNKPIDQQKVLNVLQRYLPAKPLRGIKN
ncbi:MAG: response regulator [Symploca sp. SIO2D2]|nr:response regulator [Symploca sp. SIO2D2]